MKQDIITPEVQNVIVAVVPRNNGTEEELWDTYIVNLRTEPMESVLITSQGYGEINGSDKTTTVLRHFHQIIQPNSFLKVEPIQRELFSIKNEYWISFNDGDQMLDKRYVFEAGQISVEALKEVPVLDRPGVMLR
jgi:hypothetical protein